MATMVSKLDHQAGISKPLGMIADTLANAAKTRWMRSASATSVDRTAVRFYGRTKKAAMVTYTAGQAIAALIP